MTGEDDGRAVASPSLLAAATPSAARACRRYGVSPRDGDALRQHTFRQLAAHAGAGTRSLGMDVDRPADAGPSLRSTHSAERTRLHRHRCPRAGDWYWSEPDRLQFVQSSGIEAAAHS